MPSEPKVSYFYDTECYVDPEKGTKHAPTAVYYGHRHPMKPHRISMAHSLLTASPYWPRLRIQQPAAVSREALQAFCTDDYYGVLSARRDNRVWDAFERMVVNGHSYEDHEHLHEFGIQDDCPIFESIFDFSKSACAASIGAAVLLNHRLSDVSINWAGGLHHARMDKACGFCYINDIVLGILELLKYNARVLYIDIDIHHGDGVEEAFFNTNRVMTVSFHKYSRGERDGDDFFFPGTGDICDIGPRGGHEATGYAVNVPLSDGLSDKQFHEQLFVPVITEVMTRFAPGAVVLQSGADSVAGDKIGKFNISTLGHASAGRWLRRHYPDVPVMVLGGGGYTISNVARTWCYETISMLGIPDTDIPRDCPIDMFYFEHMKQEKHWEEGCVPFRVAELSTLQNKNVDERLGKIVQHIRMNLKQYVSPVSVPFAPVARDAVADPVNMGSDVIEVD